MVGLKLSGALSALVLCGAGSAALPAFAAAKAPPPPADAYSHCATNAATSLRLDGDYAADWTTPERPVGAYPDGSVEGTSRNNVYAEGGALHLIAKRADGNILSALVPASGKLRDAIMRTSFARSNLTSRFMSGRVISRRPIRFGCVEFTARLPHGRGFWPALWMRTPSGEPLDGEIDLVEGFGSHPGVFQSTLHHWTNGREPRPRIINGVDRTYTCARVVADTPRPNAITQDAIKKARWAGTDRWRLPNWAFANAETKCVMAPVDPAVDFSRDFHRFLVVWTPDRVIWALDGKPYFESTDDVPQKAMVLSMNLSVGRMDGDADASTPALGDLQVRSVRLMALRR